MHDPNLVNAETGFEDRIPVQRISLCGVSLKRAFCTFRMFPMKLSSQLTRIFSPLVLRGSNHGNLRGYNGIRPIRLARLFSAWDGVVRDADISAFIERSALQKVYMGRV